MIDTTRIDEWLKGYLSAWASDDPSDIRRLFTDDIVYSTAPLQDTLSGIDQVLAWWIEQKESGLRWTFDYEVIAREGDLYVVRGVTRYPDGLDRSGAPEVYHNLWLITLAADDRAGEFIEYWMLADQEKDLH